MIEKLTAIFSEVLECEQSVFTSATEFRNLSEWDSLAYLSVIAMIDEVFGVLIPQVEFKRLKTIADIEKHIQSKA